MSTIETVAGTPVTAVRPRPVALLLPGQGAQRQAMAAGLYRAEPEFTAAVDEVFESMGDDGARVRADWLADRPRVPIDHVTRAQPLLFAIDYALGRLVLSWGIRPAALLGHSMGELVAATLAGVFGLDDAVRLVRDRVRRADAAPPGGMLAVSASPAELDDLVGGDLAGGDLAGGDLAGGDVVVGAVNAPRQTILAGRNGPLEKVAEILRGRGVTCRRVPSLTAFHSPLLEAVNAGSERLVAEVRTSPPDIPIYSGYTGALLRPDEVHDPAFWARQMVAPVMFWPALEALLAAGDFLLLEAGPGADLATLARRHPAVRGRRSVARTLLPGRPGPAEADRAAVRQAVEALRAEGHPVRAK
ncbi:acyltransferase domain-containing protein [Spirillospora sp. NPDC047279]|uniref:acyltransferase domain-containing protein n=1 Tax=Spirillospora sp. NPDC047279 TaxID=3155478 RepID=UPI0033C5E5F5